MRNKLLAVLMFATLAACGGGGGGGDTGGAVGSGGGGGGGSPPPPPPSPPGAPPPPPPPPAGPLAPPTPADASRFLTQATFGPTDASISAVLSQGYTGWIDAQVAAPLPARSHTAAVSDWDLQFNHSWWRQAITSNDQLRQRVTFALSQIFVVSLSATELDPKGVASYYDMLQRNALGNYRTLLEEVTLHPMMGEYLTFLANQKEQPSSGRTPDENYAREVMQLMSIGLVELNNDGTPRLNGGQSIPTYTSADIAGLAKVFTGWSYYNPIVDNNSFRGGNDHPEMYTRPMIAYPSFHSTSAKVFLGTTIPASGTIDMAGDLRIALDRLFNHPNVGPFISHRLIQQLVTSNPSPAFVNRVATVFNNNGAGVRGDLAAVVRAILTDAEARNSPAGAASFGKLREPVIRLANWARAFNATSTTGNYEVPYTNLNTVLGQGAMYAPSVFNFWRPGFTPPGTTQLGQRSLVAPEFQGVDEVTVATYANYMQSTIDAGTGYPTDFDVRGNYAAEVAIADNPQALVDRLNLLLFYGQMSSTLQQRIVAAVSAVNLPASNQNGSRLTRAKIAIFLSMVSPEYLVQR